MKEVNSVKEWDCFERNDCSQSRDMLSGLSPGDCGFDTLNYEDFERDLLKVIDEIEVVDLPIADIDIGAKKTELESIKSQIEKFTNAIGMISSPDALPSIINKLESLQRDYDSLNDEIKRHIPTTTISRKNARLKSAYRDYLTDINDNEKRRVLRTCLFDVVDKVKVYKKNGTDEDMNEGRYFEVYGDFRGAQRFVLGFCRTKRLRKRSPGKVG